MEIKGYTLHGDYYLANKVIIGADWKEACKMKEIVVLPNGKSVIAHTLSKEELKTIPEKERECSKWYWTSTPIDDNYAYYVHNAGDFNEFRVSHSNDHGGIRLGFKNPF